MISIITETQYQLQFSELSAYQEVVVRKFVDVFQNKLKTIFDNLIYKMQHVRIAENETGYIGNFLLFACFGVFSQSQFRAATETR